MFSDSRESLVEGALQVLCVTLEIESSDQRSVSVDGTSGGTAMEQSADVCISCPIVFICFHKEYFRFKQYFTSM